MAPIAIGIGIGPTFHGGGVGGAGGFDPASLFTTEQGVVYDLPDPANVFQQRTGASATTPSGADGPIGSLKDLSPNNNWATAVSDVARPLWRAAGYADFDGIDDFLTSLFTIAPTITRIACWARLLPETNGHIFTGGTATQTTLYRSAAASFSSFNGAAVGPITFAPATFVVTTERFSGATSRIALNNNAYITGDAGAGSTPGGLKIARDAGTAAFAAMQLVRLIEIARNLSDDEVALSRTWCGSGAGLVL